MNIPSIRSLRRLGATLIAGLLASTAFSQGSLTPPAGAPGPTQKSLQQIWDKIDALETQARGLQDQVGTLQNDNAALGILLENAGVALPWRTTVATNTLVQYFLNATNHAYWTDSLSLAISPQGVPAISWQDGQFNSYAAEEGTRWKTTQWPMDEPVGGGWKRFQFVSGTMGFLPSGQPVIAGFESIQGVATNLVLKSLAGVATNLLTIPSTADAYFPRLAFSSHGRPEITYMQGFFPASATLRIVHQTAGGWTNTVVATNLMTRRQSMATSSSGQTGIAYQEAGTEDLRLAYRHAGGFTNTLVTTDHIFSHSLAFDPSGQPAIAYSTWDGFNVLFHLTTLAPGPGGFDTGVWSVETFDPGVIGLGVGWTSSLSLAFGANGRPVVAYSDPDLGVRYAAKNAGGAWDITQIAPPKADRNLSYDTVLRFNRSGQPVIAFWDDSTATIRVATRAPYVAP